MQRLQTRRVLGGCEGDRRVCMLCTKRVLRALPHLLCGVLVGCEG